MKRIILFSLIFLFSFNFNSNEFKKKDFYCIWTTGSNMWYQLGMDRNNLFENIPIQVLELEDIVSISAVGSKSLVLKSDGTVWGWGYNHHCELGNGTNRNAYTPVQMLIENAISVSAGYLSLVLKADGTLWATGYEPCEYYEELKIPVQVPDFENIAKIAEHGTFAIKSDGTVWQIEFIKRIPTAVQVQGLKKIVSVSTGYPSLALKSDGSVWEWAYDLPIQKVEGLQDVVEVSASNNFSLALKKDGTVWAWGYNEYGQLGNGTNDDSDTPVQVLNLDNVIAISAGGKFSLALKSDGTVWAWGWNKFGQLGIGSFLDTNIPLKVKTIQNPIKISAGGVHSIFLAPFPKGSLN